MKNGSAAKSSNSSKSDKLGNDATLADLTEQVETLKNDISGLISLVGEVGKAEASRTVDAAKAQGAAAKQLSEEQLGRLQETATGYRQNAEEYVQRKPEMALGIAAGVGLLVGMLMTRRG